MKEKGDGMRYGNDYKEKQTKKQEREEEGTDARTRWRDSEA